MINIKYILIAMMLNTSFLMAATLETSDNPSNLEIVTDTACQNKETNLGTQTAQEPEEELVVPRTQEVETVNYTLHGCNGIASFPVTVRSNKKRGE